MVTFLLTLLFCCLPIISSQDCISIDQPDDGYLHQPTTLHCKVGSAGSGDENISMAWYFNEKPLNNSPTYLSSVLGNNVHISEDYDWKITSAWDEVSETFSLTIKNTTLMDDAAYTQWECHKINSTCSDSVCHTFVVNGKCFINRKKFMIESNAALKSTNDV